MANPEGSSPKRKCTKERKTKRKLIPHRYLCGPIPRVLVSNRCGTYSLYNPVRRWKNSKKRCGAASSFCSTSFWTKPYSLAPSGGSWGCSWVRWTTRMPPETVGSAAGINPSWTQHLQGRRPVWMPEPPSTGNLCFASCMKNSTELKG